MRISGYTDFNLRTVFVKDRQLIVDKIQNLDSIRAKILSVNSNAVRLLLDDAELIATSNIPLDNLLGEEINFTVLKNGAGLILQPKIEGSALEKELNIKIFNLISDLNLANSKENRELIKEMIKQNIPITLEKFKYLKDNINSLNMIKQFPENEIKNLFEDIENLNEKEVKDILKNIYINKQGTNIEEALKDIKNLDLSKRDLIFLFKNDIKLNLQNLKILNGFLKNEDLQNLINELETIVDSDEDNINNNIIKNNVDTMIKENEKNVKNMDKNQIVDTSIEQEASTEQLDDVKDMKNIKNLKDIISLKDDVVDKDRVDKKEIDTKTDIKDNKLVDEKQVSSSDKETSKDTTIKSLLKEVVKDLQVEKEVNLLKFKESMHKLVEELTKGKFSEKDGVKEINQKLEFLNKLSNDQYYFQIPFVYKEYKNMAEVLIKKNKCKNMKKDNEVSIFISLNTNNLMKMDALLNYSNSILNIVFNGETKKILDLLKFNETTLVNGIKSIGINNVCINYRIREKNTNMLSNLEQIQNEFSNFSLWV